MTSLQSLLKYITNVKDSVRFTNIELKNRDTADACMVVTMAPAKRFKYRCPVCGRQCAVYDKLGGSEQSVWRAKDFGDLKVCLTFPSTRVICPEHGVKTTKVSWAYPDSRFTKSFDLEVTYLATQMSKKAIAESMRVDWKTVGRCVSRTQGFLEPNTKARFKGLKRIGIDETSYKKGHKYITVVVNHDTNQVVWAAEGHGKEVLSKFMEELTPKQKAAIKVVSADGAKWIDSCLQEHLKKYDRCIDSFHVIQWVTEAVEEVRKTEWRHLNNQVRQIEKSLPKRSRGRPTKADEVPELTDLKKRAGYIKNSRYPLCKGRENLTENQELKLQMLLADNPQLAEAHALKERMRLILKFTNPQAALEELRLWVVRAEISGIEPVVALAEKIKRHMKNIINTLRHRLSNARVEANNNKIKRVIRNAFGFSNIKNLLDMVLLVCSGKPIPKRSSEINAENWPQANIEGISGQLI
jgi:transposase